MRYTGDIRLRLSSPAARVYDDAGRLLLGELLARGLITATDRRVLPDGAIVIAHVRGSQRIVELIEPPHGTREAQGQLAFDTLSGFVTRPRNIDANENVFGLHSHVLLSRAGEGWASRFYDASYGDPLYTTIAGKPVFPTGFDDGGGATQAGNLDWRNRDETLALTWRGTAERFQMNASDYGRYVYHNGAVLVDAGSGVRVLGACLRRGGNGLRVYWATGDFDLFAADLLPDRDVIPWWPQEQGAFGCPRLRQVEAADKVLVAALNGSPTIWSFAFNQRATECRMLCREDNGEGGYAIVEYVTQFADEAEVAASSATKGTLQFRLSETREGQNVTTGTLTTASSATSYTASKTIEDTGGTFPIAVDYENDVPTRLWLKVAAGSSSCSFSETDEHTETIGSVGDPFTTQTDTEAYSDTTAGMFTSSGTLAGGLLYAETEAGERWFSLSIGGEYTATSSLSLSQSGSYTETSTYTGDGITHSWTFVGVDEHTNAISASTTLAMTWNDVFLWWVDLRSRSLVVTDLVVTQTDNDQYLRAGSGGRTQTGPNDTILGEPVRAPTFSPDSTGSVVVTDIDQSVLTYTYTTQLHFHGELVDTLTASVVDTFTSNDSYAATEEVAHPGMSTAVSLPTYPMLPNNSVPGTNTSVSTSTSNTVTTSELPISLRNGVIELAVSEQVIDLVIGNQHDPFFIFSPSPLGTGQLVTNRFGNFIAYRGGWAYSMPALQGTFTSDTLDIADWTSRLSGDDFDARTGNHHPEQYATMWPLCGVILGARKV
jgi:hypothetical protein